MRISINIIKSNLQLILQVFLLLIVLPNLALNARAEEIPYPHNSHVFGMSTVLSGPIAHLGINMRHQVRPTIIRKDEIMPFDWNQ